MGDFWRMWTVATIFGQWVALLRRQGFPLIRAEPYLAELAYLRGDYATTRRLMTSLREDGRSRSLRMAADYWGQ